MTLMAGRTTGIAAGPLRGEVQYWCARHMPRIPHPSPSPRHAPEGLTRRGRRNQPVTARLGATQEIRTFLTDRASTVEPFSAVVVIAQ